MEGIPRASRRRHRTACLAVAENGKLPNRWVHLDRSRKGAESAETRICMHTSSMCYSSSSDLLDHRYFFAI